MPEPRSRIEVPPDALLCLYTDGLVERRGKSSDAGLAEIRRSLFLGRPDAVCAAVMASGAGQEPVSDDAALLSARRKAGPRPVAPGKSSHARSPS